MQATPLTLAVGVRVSVPRFNTSTWKHHEGVVVEQAQNGEGGIWAIHVDGSGTDYETWHWSELLVIG